MKSFSILAMTLCAAGFVLCAKAANPAQPAEKAVPGKFTLPDPVAVVEGKEISAAEVQQAVETILHRTGKKSSDFSDSERETMMRTAVRNLIAQQFLANRSLEVKVSDAELDTRYQQFLAQIPDKKKFDEQLKATNMTGEKLREKLREEMRRQKWLEEKVGTQGVATEADAKAFYDANPAYFDQPELIRASHILITVPENAKPEVVAVKKKIAETLAERIANGDDFAILAKENSDDTGSKANGGDLNYFAKQRMIPEFGDAAFALKQDQVSAPVRTKFGFHLIKLTDRKAARKLPFDEVKEKIVSRLTDQNKQHVASEMVKKLMEKADVKVNLPPETKSEAAPSPVKSSTATSVSK